MSVILKSLPMEAKQGPNGNLIFKISTNLQDRDEDILEPQGVRLENYRRNSVVLFAHDYSSLPVGKSLWEKVYPDCIESEVEFAPTAFAQDCKKLCEGGFLNAASVGFVGHKYEPIEGSRYGKRYTEWELLEWSIVPVPSNAASLIQGAKEKGLNLDAIEKELVNMSKNTEDKGVIPYKKYPTEPESTAWNGPAEIAAAEVDDLKIMCAWYDAENADAKQAYKLPHHTQADKTTVWRGVSAAMGALLGARGGVDIPEGDRKGAYSHLAKHYKDFDKEAPEFKEYAAVELKAIFEVTTKTPDTEGNPSTYDIEREIQNAINPNYIMPGVWVADLYPINYPSGKAVICRQNKFYLHGYTYEKVNDTVKLTLDEGLEVEIGYNEKAYRERIDQKSGATLSAKNKKELNEIHETITKCSDRFRKFIDAAGMMPDEPMMTATRTAPVAEATIKVELPDEFKQALEEIKTQVLLLSQKGAPKDIDLDAIEWTPATKDAETDELDIEPGELKAMIAQIVQEQLKGGSTDEN